MIIRQQYLDSLISYRDKPIIKIITGMRRCGKSSILNLFKNYLVEDGVPAANIITINLELSEFDNISTHQELYIKIKSKLPAGKRSYLFLDEIQLIKDWDKAINRLYSENIADIYLTSSNSFSMPPTSNFPFSSNSHIIIKILPLSFQEYLQFVLWKRQKEGRQYNFLRRLPRSFMDQNENIKLDLKSYLEFGGLPTIPFLPQENDIITGFLEGVYNSIIIKNVLLTADKSIKDIQTLKKVVRYVAKNTGNFISPTFISADLSSRYKNGDYDLNNIAEYILLLERAYVFYEIQCFDINNNDVITSSRKYYLADSGIRNMLLSFSNTHNIQNMETVIYFELLRRGYNVFCGKYNNHEIDFFILGPRGGKCFQCAISLKNTAAIKNKLNPLKELPDNYEKTIISMDDYYDTEDDKIKFLNFADFLLENESHIF